MPNPIADPLVQNVVSPEVSRLVRIDADASGVAVVTIDNPAKGNGLDGPTIAALHEAFETLHGADHVRLVFLRGEGGTFCRGADPEWTAAAADWTEGEIRDEAMAAGAMFRALSDIPALTVALVEGEALGGGAGLVAACDTAVATADARFAFPEVRRGLLPAMISPYVMNAIGPRNARLLFATGRPFDAAQALRIGLVHGIVEGAQGLAQAQADHAAEILACAPGAVAEAKRLVRDVSGRPIDRSLTEDLARRSADRRMDDEARQGVEAALQGRSADWTALGGLGPAG